MRYIALALVHAKLYLNLGLEKWKFSLPMPGQFKSMVVPVCYELMNSHLLRVYLWIRTRAAPVAQVRADAATRRQDQCGHTWQKLLL